VTLGTDLNGNGTTNDNIEERPAAFSFAPPLIWSRASRPEQPALPQHRPDGRDAQRHPDLYGPHRRGEPQTSQLDAEHGGAGLLELVADSIGDANNVAVVLRVTDSLGYYDERTVR
jgi:hypothetical protein